MVYWSIIGRLFGFAKNIEPHNGQINVLGWSVVDVCDLFCMNAKKLTLTVSRRATGRITLTKQWF
jgi:hypothetical protein